MKSEFELGKDPKRIVKTRKLHQLPIDARKTGWKQNIYYNPKEFTAGIQDQVGPDSTSKNRPYVLAGWVALFIVGCIVSAVFWRYVRTH